MTQDTKQSSPFRLRGALLVLGLICALAAGWLLKRDGTSGQAQSAGASPSNAPRTGAEFPNPGGRQPTKSPRPHPNYSEANRDTPRIWAPGGPQWVERTDVEGHEEVLAIVEYRFSLHDRKITATTGRMLEHARPISTKDDAGARIKDASIVGSMLSMPARAFETAEYYIMASMVHDYNMNFELYKRTHPPEEHPVCEFKEYGYAIRKSDGHAVQYSKRYLIEEYGYQSTLVSAGPAPSGGERGGSSGPTAPDH